MSNVISLEDYKRRKLEERMKVRTTPAPQQVLNKQMDKFWDNYYKLSSDANQSAKEKQEHERRIRNEQVKNQYKMNKDKR